MLFSRVISPPYPQTSVHLHRVSCFRSTGTELKAQQHAISQGKEDGFLDEKNLVVNHTNVLLFYYSKASPSISRDASLPEN